MVGRDAGADAEAMTEVVVPAARREAALATMAEHMDEIRDRMAPSAAPPPAPADTAATSEADPAPGTRPLVTERLRRLWPLPVLLVPLLVLLGAGSLPANFVVLVLIGGMVAMVALRQRRRR